MTRLIVYAAIWVGFTYVLRKNSAGRRCKWWFEYYRSQCLLRPCSLFCLPSLRQLLQWDFLMSIDSHWFSTLFGCTTFIGLFVSGLGMMCMFIILYLKGRGYMEHVTETSCMMSVNLCLPLRSSGLTCGFRSLCWSGMRICLRKWLILKCVGKNFRTLWALNLCVTSLRRSSCLWPAMPKRQMRILWVAGIIISAAIGSMCTWWWWPGTMGTKAQIGFVEIGTMIGYLGLFIWSTLSELSKASLVPKNHPMLQESLHHHI